MTGNVQFPNYQIDLKGTEELVITTPATADARLVIEGSSNTTFYVFQKSTGQLFAKVETVDNTPISIAVPKGVLLVQKRVGEEILAAEVSIPYGGRRELVSYEFESVSYDTAMEKGGRIDLYPHRLFAGYQFLWTRYPNSMLARHSAFVGYGRAWSRWMMDIHAATSPASFVSGTYETKDIRTDLSVLLGPLFALRRVTFFVGGGPVGIWDHQHRRRVDAERLENLNTDALLEESDDAFGIGGKVLLRLTIPIYGRLECATGLGGAVWAARIKSTDGAKVHALFDVIANVGLGIRL